MSFNQPEDLTSKVKTLGQQYNENELQDELDRAHRKLDSKVGRVFVEYKQVETHGQETFNLAFSEILQFNNARFIERNDLIDDSNYTVDTAAGSISFSTSFAEDKLSPGDKLKLEYVPTRFKDLELWLAVLSLIRTTSLQTREGETSISVEEAKTHVDEITESINGKSGNRKVRDHRPRFYPHRTTL